MTDNFVEFHGSEPTQVYDEKPKTRTAFKILSITLIGALIFFIYGYSNN